MKSLVEAVLRARLDRLSQPWACNLNAFNPPDPKLGEVSYRGRRHTPTSIFIKILRSKPWKGAKVTCDGEYNIFTKGSAVLRIKVQV